jgi:hypothetical protein
MTVVLLYNAYGRRRCVTCRRLFGRPAKATRSSSLRERETLCVCVCVWMWILCVCARVEHLAFLLLLLEEVFCHQRHDEGHCHHRLSERRGTSAILMFASRICTKERTLSLFLSRCCCIVLFLADVLQVIFQSSEDHVITVKAGKFMLKNVTVKHTVRVSLSLAVTTNTIQLHTYTLSLYLHLSLFLALMLWPCACTPYFSWADFFFFFCAAPRAHRRDLYASSSSS